jgi:methionyl-tRNA formyltransferase
MNTKRVVFLGSKTLGVRVLEELYSISPEMLIAVITINDSNDSRSALDRFHKFQQNTGKPLRILKKGAELKSAIDEFHPDLCLVVGWYWILKPDLLKMVPSGWLGIHASLLPKYRGGAPLVWAIINGETETGLSLFYFDEGMDTGDIVAQKKLVIGPDETIADVLQKAETLSVRMVQENYPLLINDTAPRFQQDHSKATYVAMRNPEDGQIDWNNMSTMQVYNWIRAQTTPYPGAFTFIGDEKLIIWKASVSRDEKHDAKPGEIYLTRPLDDPDTFGVWCKDGRLLRIHQIGLPDGTVMSGAEFIAKRRILSGTVFVSRK